MSCKVNPKTYFKGWAEYTCVNHLGRVSKYSQNFDKDNTELGLSSSKEIR